MKHSYKNILYTFYNDTILNQEAKNYNYLVSVNYICKFCLKFNQYKCEKDCFKIENDPEVH